MFRKNKSIKEISLFSEFIYIYLFWLVLYGIVSLSLLRYSHPYFQNMLDLANSVFRYIFLIYSLLLILRPRNIKKYLFVVYLIYIIITVGSIVTSRDFRFIDTFFISVFLSEYITYKKAVKTFFLSIVSGLIIVIALYYMHFFPTYHIYRGNTERIALGFRHPNTLGMLVLLLAMLFVLYKDMKFRYYDYILLYLLALWVYVYPNSQTSALIIIFMNTFVLLTNIRNRRNKKENRKFSKILRWLPFFLVPGLLAVVYIITIVFSGVSNTGSHNFFYTFSLRFVFGYRAIHSYGIHMWGNRNVRLVGGADAYFNNLWGRISSTTYSGVDCFYIYIIVVYGIIPALFYFFYYAYCMYQNIRKRNTALWLCLIMVLLFYLSENSISNALGSFLFILSNCRYMPLVERYKEVRGISTDYAVK